ncbi:RagB/SusD family nutrient uptake outer membrane protein [Maribacter ulvicola]|uniref:Starch-binding associating with outer membrane n=1 Tax=Maribacter ulvicola TaxID=228959 RepID=A0A1N6X814_9FLAO|nr:RagB/SusD family nutrient uptake outer membrane protein [Maribacter ulvicola]SIQ98456.1 Starch-binding associating with outer membrane [Maribacter ulvicola]
MKRNIKYSKNFYWAVIFIVTLVFSSCTQELDLAPRTSLSEVSFWNTPNDFKLATNRYYNTLLPQHGSGGEDNNSDITYGNGQNDVSAGNLLTSANDGNWDNSYQELRQINTMLQKATEYSGDHTEIAVSVAEGKFFRAYTYYNLVTRFGDVPYFDKPLKGEKDENLFTPRTSRETVINNIITDLDEAVKDLPLQSELEGTDVGRITKGAAWALKARVTLFEATWSKYHETESNVNDLLNQSITAAQAVIESGEYELFTYAPAPEDSYLNSYLITGNDSKEQILARRYFPDVRTHTLGNWVCCNGTNDYTKKLVDMYTATDGLPISISPLFKGYGTILSEYENRDLRMTNTIAIPGGFHISRENREGLDAVYPSLTTDEETGYKSRKLVAIDEDGISNRAWEFKHVIKYSEVLLILAEALYERDGAISDTDLNATVNLLRARGGVAALTNELVTTNDLNMLEQLRNERTIELASDGYRLLDLRRWGTAEIELNKDIKGVNIGNGSWDVEYPGVSTMFPTDVNGFRIVEDAATRQFGEKNYLFPIPTQQIQLSNGTLEQNPGW